MYPTFGNYLFLKDCEKLKVMIILSSCCQLVLAVYNSAVIYQLVVTV